MLQSGRSRTHSGDASDREAAERLLNFASEEYRDWARDALGELFPLFKRVLGGPSYSGNIHKIWISTRRVCTSRYFARYFELQTALGELSESEYVKFLAATSNKASLADATMEIEANGLLPSLVARWDEAVDRLPVENAQVLLPEMFRVAQKLVGWRGADLLGSPWTSAWRATSWFMKRVPGDICGELAIHSLQQTEALSVAAILIHLNDPADHANEHGFDPVLDQVTVATMKAEWLKQVRFRATEPGRLLDEPDLVSWLYQWQEYSGSSDEPKGWVADAIKSDEGFAKMVSRMMTSSIRHRSGDRVSTIQKVFQREPVENFIGIVQAKARCDEIDPTAFPQDQEAIRILLSHLGSVDKLDSQIV